MYIYIYIYIVHIYIYSIYIVYVTCMPCCDQFSPPRETSPFSLSPGFQRQVSGAVSTGFQRQVSGFRQRQLGFSHGKPRWITMKPLKKTMGNMKYGFVWITRKICGLFGEIILWDHMDLWYLWINQYEPWFITSNTYRPLLYIQWWMEGANCSERTWGLHIPET